MVGLELHPRRMSQAASISLLVDDPLRVLRLVGVGEGDGAGHADRRADETDQGSSRHDELMTLLSGLVCSGLAAIAAS